ncbi:hypothetical protein TcCL_NonESM10432, partial [Trypanosoma cruzi]
GHHRSSSSTRNKKKKQKRGGGVGDRGAAVTVASRRRCSFHGCGRRWCFFRIGIFIFILFSFCCPAPSAAGSLFRMPSSVLLSASLLAASPFAVGDGGPDSALSSWTCCSGCTSGKFSVLECTFIVAGGGGGVTVFISASLAGLPRVSVGAS